MSISLVTLLSITDTVCINAEPYDWVERRATVFFTNRSTGETFWLPLNAVSNQYFDEGYEFHLPNSEKTVWIEFYTHTIISPELLETL